MKILCDGSDGTPEENDYLRDVIHCNPGNDDRSTGNPIS